MVKVSGVLCLRLGLEPLIRANAISVTVDCVAAQPPDQRLGDSRDD